MNDPTAGEVGGIFAGIVALLIAIGHGIRWWLGWTDRRAATRAAKLDAWQRELTLREERLDREQSSIIAEIKEQIAALKSSNEELKTSNSQLRADGDQLRREHAGLLGGFQLVAGALRELDPHNDALRRADELLKASFPLEPLLSPTLSGPLAKLDNID